MYAGNMDGSSCNVLGVGRTLAALHWADGATYRNATPCVWRKSGSGAPIGMLKRGGGLAFLTVLNSGHLVPMCQPEVAREMMRALEARR